MNKVFIIGVCLFIVSQAVLAVPWDSDESSDERLSDRSDESREEPRKLVVSDDDSREDSNESAEVRRRDDSRESEEEPRKLSADTSDEDSDDSQESPLDLFFKTLRDSKISRAQRAALLKALLSRYAGY
uniref:Orchestin n=1 Tax=Cryptorchestia cavimana TaxID=1577145 RepID=ORCH_CRYCV|nr:RecName: Full=Orchestin; Flags: Precursor [Cryptorchestia cavimana]AAD32571.1 orchestin precursor [Cryptorchestia cavimana]